MFRSSTFWFVRCRPPYVRSLIRTSLFPYRGVYVTLPHSLAPYTFYGVRVFPKGGVFYSHVADDWIHEAGATIILRNSFFDNNTAGGDSGGVGYLGENGTLRVEGDDNVFYDNTCGTHGGVFAATSYTSIIVDGGSFKGNGHGEVSTLTLMCLR